MMAWGSLRFMRPLSLLRARCRGRARQSLHARRFQERNAQKSASSRNRDLEGTKCTHRAAGWREMWTRKSRCGGNEALLIETTIFLTVVPRRPLDSYDSASIPAFHYPPILSKRRVTESTQRFLEHSNQPLNPQLFFSFVHSPPSPHQLFDLGLDERGSRRETLHRDDYRSREGVAESKRKGVVG